jgi:hypothetical protein
MAVPHHDLRVLVSEVLFRTSGPQWLVRGGEGLTAYPIGLTALPHWSRLQRAHKQPAAKPSDGFSVLTSAYPSARVADGDTKAFDTEELGPGTRLCRHTPADSCTLR